MWYKGTYMFSDKPNVLEKPDWATYANIAVSCDKKKKEGENTKDTFLAFGPHQWSLGLTPDSTQESLLAGSGDHMGYLGSNPVQQCARQVPYSAIFPAVMFHVTNLSGRYFVSLIEKWLKN